MLHGKSHTRPWCQVSTPVAITCAAVCRCIAAIKQIRDVFGSRLLTPPKPSPQLPSTPLNSPKISFDLQQVEQSTGVPAAQQHYWVWKRRNNRTVRATQALGVTALQDETLTELSDWRRSGVSPQPPHTHSH